MTDGDDEVGAVARACGAEAEVVHAVPLRGRPDASARVFVRFLGPAVDHWWDRWPALGRVLSRLSTDPTVEHAASRVVDPSNHPNFLSPADGWCGQITVRRKAAP